MTAVFFACGVGAGTGGTGLMSSTLDGSAGGTIDCVDRAYSLSIGCVADTSAGCVPTCPERAAEGRTTEGVGVAELLPKSSVVAAAARYALPAADA